MKSNFSNPIHMQEKTISTVAYPLAFFLLCFIFISVIFRERYPINLIMIMLSLKEFRSIKLDNQLSSRDGNGVLYFPANRRSTGRNNKSGTGF